MTHGHLTIQDLLHLPEIGNKFSLGHLDLSLLADPKDSFLSSSDKARIQGYNENTSIYRGEHDRVWPELRRMLQVSHSDSRTPFKLITMNDAVIITDLIVNLFLRKPPIITAEDPRSQDFIDHIWGSNHLDCEIKEVARSNSYLGDAVAQIWYGQRQDENKARVHINFVDPSLFVGSFDPFNSRVMTGGTLQSILPGPNKKKFLYRQIHMPGIILNQLWELSGTRLVKQVSLETLSATAGKPEVEFTQVDELLLVHIPNSRQIDSPYGISDYTEGIKSKFRARTEVASQFNMVRAKHSNPKLGLPQSIIDLINEEQNSYSSNGGNRRPLVIPAEDRDVIGLTPGEDAKYITWDGQLNAAQTELEFLQKQIFQEAKISPALLGDDISLDGATGRANIIKLMASLGLADSKQDLWRPAIQNILRKAQKLAIQNGEQGELTEVSVEFHEVLPGDRMAHVNEVIQQLNSGLLSRKSAIQQLNQLTEDQIDQELQNIAAEGNSQPA